MANPITFKLMSPDGKVKGVQAICNKYLSFINNQATNWNNQHDFEVWAEQSIQGFLESIIRHRFIQIIEKQ